MIQGAGFRIHDRGCGKGSGMGNQESGIETRDVMIIGAGPAGLAAAIAATKAGLTYQVIEKGALVNSLLRYPTEMVFFTTPELMEIGGLPFTSPHDKPSRIGALRYYRRATDTYKLDAVFAERVAGLTRDADGFLVEAAHARGGRRAIRGRTAILATGAYDFPNLIGVPGEDLPHVSHYYTAPHPFYRKRVVIVGGKNSAAEAALELYRAGARVTIVHRRDALGESIKYWVKPDIENRIKEGSVEARFNTTVVASTTAAGFVGPAGGRCGIPAAGAFLLQAFSSANPRLAPAAVAFDPR